MPPADSDADGLMADSDGLVAHSTDLVVDGAAPEPDGHEALPALASGAQHVVIVTGLSGAGKTAASKLFEDLGYTVVDNVPPDLLRDLAELVANDPERYRRVALVLDVRTGNAPLALGAAMGALQGRDLEPQVFFLEASDETLIRRFSETRHRHPLDTGGGLAVAIQSERDMLQDIRAEADEIIDTSGLSGRQLRERIQSALRVAREPDSVYVNVISFGYKYGLPLEADVVFDVRFMENPFYVPELRAHNGLSTDVRDFVLGQPVTRRFLEFAGQFFEFAIPAYQSEGKTRLTIAIGCTGGFHRSVAIAEALAAGLRQESALSVNVFHRELQGK
jgi:RNase adapter protein RapZ